MLTSSKFTSRTPSSTRNSGIPLATLASPRTTSTSTQMTMQARLNGIPGPCYNGGTSIQGSCSCPRTFYGSLCQFAVEQMDIDTVDAEVGMEVSVDQEFSSDLNDNTSQSYKNFSNSFLDQIQRIYQNVQGFKDVKILSLRNGSIVVDYLVQLELPFSLQLESEYEKVKIALKEELQNVSQDGNSCQNDQDLCFKPDSIKLNNITRTELSPEAICSRAAAEGYEDFYFPLLVENRLRCVTKCTRGVDGAIDCHQGQCLLERSGPACRCFSSDTYWFLGPHCEVSIPWRALVGGLAGASALMLLLVALSVFLARSRKSGGQGGGRSWDDRKWFETWDENTVGTFLKLGFEDDGTVKDGAFHVALENVDSNVRMHIHRSEVTSSSL
ncbi:mucin-3A [Vicugna pacos]|uniref:Mucin-3A n=1 Tax=Vicugna pacos TaxID=30538 RepID=A0ABM5BP85_VICPA